MRELSQACVSGDSQVVPIQASHGITLPSTVCEIGSSNNSSDMSSQGIRSEMSQPAASSRVALTVVICIAGTYVGLTREVPSGSTLMVDSMLERHTDPVTAQIA